MIRASRDQYFMLNAIMIATRASCIKFRSWAVIVKNNRIVASGYNWNPKWITSCHEQWFCNKDKAWVDRTQKWSWHCLATHAEANAIIQNHEQSLEWATMYCLHFPCNECAKLIVSSWIKEVVYLKMYREAVSNSEMMFNQAWVKFRKMELDYDQSIENIKEVMTSTKE